MADVFLTPEKLSQIDSDHAKNTSTEDLIAELGSAAEGLSSAEAAKRLEQFGPNALPDKKVSPLLKFLSFFWGPIPWMIEIAAILSLAVGHWADFAVILVLLIFNAVLGFYEEFQAGNAIEALKNRLALKARAKRDGDWKEVPAADLVIGDVMRIRIGDIVPSDAKILSCQNVACDQSALTGESLPVEKEPGDLVFSGSVMQRGEAEAVVFATGENTFLGRTAKLVATAKPVSHYQQSVLAVGRLLIAISVVLIAVIIIVSMFRQQPLLDTVQFALILAVAAIPVALPAVLSVTMAVGAKRLSEQKAIVSKLVSIEEMAGLNIFCSDKTGTLTQNKLHLGDTICYGSLDEQAVIRDAVLASKLEDNDPIELAIFEKLQGGKDALNGYSVTHFVPFDPVAKQTSASVSGPEGSVEIRKGAPQVIAKLTDNAEVMTQVAEKVDELAGRGFRTLGVARKAGDGAWEFTGLLSMFDPPREDSASTIKATKEMGLDFKMITGDHLAIAKETASQLGMGTKIYSADEAFDKDHPFTPEQIEAADGFAQVFPEHKYNIVATLQKSDHYVGMTGDGVNDAPALRQADAGVAVSGATDAARSAADLVLTAPGLSVIVSAIAESRRIFERMQNYAAYRICETVAILFFITLAILLFHSYPLSTAMIIVIALLNDGPIMMIAYDNVSLSPKPVRWDMQHILMISLVLAVGSLASSFFLFWFGYEWSKDVSAMSPDLVWLLGEQNIDWLRQWWLPRLTVSDDPDLSQVATLLFLKLTISGHMSLYMARTGARPFWSRPWPAWKMVAVNEGTQVIGLCMAIFGLGLIPAIGLNWTVFSILYAIAVLFIIDGFKVFMCRLITEGPNLFRQHLRHANVELHSQPSAK